MAFRQELDNNHSTSFIQARLKQELKPELSIPVGEILRADFSIVKSFDESNSCISLGSYKEEQVIIKRFTIDPEHPERASQKMLKEWNVMRASFPSQYVVKPVAYCQKPPIVIMEYVKKDALDLLMKKVTLTWSQRISIANDVALGLLRLLEVGITHRDIKSANIFITEDYRAKIGDFDLSTELDSKESITPVGTLEYIAPEYFYRDHGKVSLMQADVFSFGIVLLELSVSEYVFNTYRKILDVMESALKSTDDEFNFARLNDISRLNDIRMLKVHQIIKNESSKWPAGLKDIIKECVNGDPDKRSTMHDIQNKLTALLSKLNTYKDKSNADLIPTKELEKTNCLVM